VKLAVVTGNRHKAGEIAAFFGARLSTEHVPMDIPEYRDDDVGEIARQKAAHAYECLKRPLIVDDTGFSIAALNGFPGPYAAYVLRTIGNTGILRLLEPAGDRRAFFETAIGYADAGGIRVFRGRIDGVIVPPRGSGGFGYDPIFAVGERTLAELPVAEKSRMSHRAKALALFLDWLDAGGLVRDGLLPDS
jgi:XTP/dITP diphosphohydrolase